jgi:hypothetical protein
MRIRTVAAAGVAIAGVLLVAPPSVGPAVAAPLSLTVDPPASVAPTTVALSGACAGEPDPDGLVYPSAAFVTIQDSQLGEQQVDLTDGEFADVPFEVPDGLQPGKQTFQLRCPGSEDTFATAGFTVLAAPTLLLDPVQGSRGSTVSASGTCPAGEEAGPDLLFDGVPLVTATPDGTGAFGPTSFSVPTDADGPTHTVTTSCGGKASFTLVVPAPEPAPVPGPVPAPVPDPIPDPRPDPVPPPSLVPVPDLSDMTVGQALAALTDMRLVLADPEDQDGTVVGQDPEPRQLVPAGTVVSVELASPPGTAGASRPTIPATAVLLALLATGATTAAVSAERARRRHARERRWVEQQVVISAEPRGTRPRHVPDIAVPALDVRLEVRSGPTRLYVQEAAHAHD